MSGHVFALAAELFSVDPRPRSLVIERFISSFALMDIVIQSLLFANLMFGSVLCNEAGSNIPAEFLSPVQPKPPIEQYLALVCSTQTRMDAYAFFIQKAGFLIFFLILFGVNKYFIRRINRLHVLVMRENIPQYIQKRPVYLDADYTAQWRRSLYDFVAYKVFVIFVLCGGIASSFSVSWAIKDVKDFVDFGGNPCGPKMRYTEDIGQKMLCHFQNEFAIRLLHWASQGVSIVVMLLFVLSLAFLFLYRFRFRRGLRMQDDLDEDMITYKIIHDQSA